MTQNFDMQMKILIVGDSMVGKSNLMSRFCADAFNESYIPTMGVDFKMRCVTFDSKVIKVQMWESPGEERFRTLTFSHYRGAQGIMVCFSLDSEESFLHVKCWLDEIEFHARRDVNIIIVGCKKDVAGRQVSVERATELAQGVNHEYFEVSTKSGENVEKCIMSLVAQMKPRLEFEMKNGSPNLIRADSFKSREPVLFERTDFMTAAVLLFPITLIGLGVYCGYNFLTHKNESESTALLDCSSLTPSQPYFSGTESNGVIIKWSPTKLPPNHPKPAVYQLQKKGLESSSWDSLGITYETSFSIKNVSLRVGFLIQIRVCDSVNYDTDMANTTRWSAWCAPVTFQESVRSPYSDVARPARNVTDAEIGDWRPYWTENTAACQLCDGKFGMSLRRHHCRECGKCVCAACCPALQTAYVDDYGKLVRICNRCHNQRKRAIQIKASRLLPAEPDFTLTAKSHMGSNGALKLEASQWAEGATAIVYRAQFNGIPVAVKQYKQSFVLFRDLRARELARNQQFGAMSRDHITMESEFYKQCASCSFAVHMLLSDVTASNSYPYIATELFSDFGTLLSVLSNRGIQLTWKWRIKVLLQVAYFLRYIADRSLVHVDLKAENCIVVALDDNLDTLSCPLVKVFDFNSSSHCGTVSPTDIRYMTRTPSHTPPEFITAHGKVSATSCNNLQEVDWPTVTLDPKYDMFSFGILMAEVASRGLFYRDEEAVSDGTKLENAMTQGERPLLTADLRGNEQLPPNYRELAESCWHAAPVSRPSPSFLVMQLESMLHELEVASKRQASLTEPASVCQSIEEEEELPLFILVLPLDAFKPPKVLNSRKLSFSSSTKASQLEKSTPGLKVFSALDSAVHFRYTSSSVSRRFDTNVLYKKHPTKPIYIATYQYLDLMFAEKVNEFVQMLQALGAREITISQCRVLDSSLEAHVGLQATDLAGVHVGGSIGSHHFDKKQMFWRFSKPQFAKPRAVEFSHDSLCRHETDWKNTVDMRIADSSVEEKAVSLRFNSDEFLNIAALVSVCQLGGISMGFAKKTGYSLAMDYHVKFYTSDDYHQCNRNAMRQWSTATVQRFLAHINLTALSELFASHALSGAILASDTLASHLKDLEVTPLRIQLVVEAVQLFVCGNSSFEG